MLKTLYVSSAVQAALMTQVFIPELVDGFWKNHRPAGHGDVWRDVTVAISEDGVLGPVGFEAPRNYNFLNLDFALPNEERLVTAAKSAKPNSNFKSVKKELIELGRIVGSRLSSRDATALKLFRGNHKAGTVTVSSAKARKAAMGLDDSVHVVPMPVEPLPVRTTVKRTVTKQTVLQLASSNESAIKIITPSVFKPQLEVLITKTAAGATVRRVPVTIKPTETTDLISV